MKWSDVINLVNRYEGVLYSDIMTEVRFGCDCGCGGDFYTDNPEAWDSMVEENASALEAVKEFCKREGIYYDGIE